MSAPPSCPVHTPAMPTMVSRLPKFGSQPKSIAASNGAQIPTPTAGTSISAAATSSLLTNGFYHHPGPMGVNGSVTAPPSAVKKNGFIRVPTSISMKWRKENSTTEDGSDAEREWKRGTAGNVGQNLSGNNIHQYHNPRQQGLPGGGREAKKSTTSLAGKVRGYSPPVTSSSSPSPQSNPRTVPVSKLGSPGSKPGQTPSRTNGTKRAPTGLAGSRPRTVSNGSLRQPHSFARPGSGPGPRSGSPFLKKPPASRSHSSDSLGSAAPVQLTEEDRSRSLTQVRQQPPPLLIPSYSNKRAAERGLKESTSSLGPPRGSLVKLPVICHTPEGRGGGVKAPLRSGVSIPSLLPPITLKKPLLPSLGPASKPSGISYKLSRPSLMKQPRPLRMTTPSVSGGEQEVNLGLNSAELASTTGNSPERSPEALEPEGLSTEPMSQTEVSIVAETLEDMSLSSASSLDRNDTSQEYMDDFDNLGDGGVGLMLLSSKNDEDDSGLDQSCARLDEDKAASSGTSKAVGLCFLEGGVDWAAVRLSGDRAEHHLTSRRRSSQPDYHEQGGSSLDLSPSDSCGSGGTYMWDEEGLEPLGGAVTTASINCSSTHHIGSFDSEANSIDVLNTLDSCDLEDDDLMLDEDFAEDVSLHSDGEGMSHMAQWRRRQLCWGTQDVHDNESDLVCYKLAEDPGNKRTDATRDDDLILDLCPSRTLGAGGVDVDDLAVDCSALRSQLEKLQVFLLQEDDVDEDTLTTDTLSPETNQSHRSSDAQVQALLQEVQQLREELRSRDQTIAQLTLQLTVPSATARCRCQEMTGTRDGHTQTSRTERESVASQTPWRENTSQVLHSSGQDDQEPLTGRLSTPLPAQAPPPARPCYETPSDATDSTTREREDDGKSSMKESRGAHSRSLKLPHPSKLRLFLSQTSSTAPPSTTRASKPPATLRDPESHASSGVRLGMLDFTFGSSRLPKPKSH
ncbi:serine-rich coiled-coil domain-containing protein 2 isoform X2 [Pleuronectes platessa]|uniref:serine-rich coiled-coil domain-containing protein 2 isoform X2 n=1 Tax=Pleuronectes platessa TaxID=8262 RepID=UPI00232A5F06|nr:serine-rich coiled-coil domain-containing protein 2 isoform X2 [Pleuronectes platessa]